MSSHNDELARLVREGPVTEIFRAEQALSIFDVTGAVADEINKQNYGEVFSTFQTFCVDQIVLSISKLYEVPRRYALKSIPSVLKYFLEHKEYLNISEPNLLNQQLNRLGLDVSAFNKLSPVGKNEYIYQELSERLPSAKDNKALAAMKTLRDKKIAHPEDIGVASLQRTTWELAKELLQYPKDVVGLIGDGYLSTVYMLDNGEYLLSSDATRVGRCTTRMLKKLGIMASNNAVEKGA